LVGELEAGWGEGEEVEIPERGVEGLGGWGGVAGCEDWGEERSGVGGVEKGEWLEIEMEGLGPVGFVDL
jgi:hypothetical protein